MMSDHWKSLTRLLGAPSAAEPPEPKRKAEEAKPADSSSPAEPPRNKDVAEKRGSAAAEGKQPAKPATKETKSGPQGDPLKEMLETPEPTSLPGFGASQQSESSSSSNWDALVKDLDVGTADTGIGKQEAAKQQEAKPARREAEADSRRGTSDRSSHIAAGRGAEPKSERQTGGFGAGLGLDLGPEPEPVTPKREMPEPETGERTAPRREPSERAAVERFAESEEGDDTSFGGPRRPRSRRGGSSRRGREEAEVADEPAHADGDADDAESTADEEGFASGLLESGEARVRADKDEEKDRSRNRRPRRGRRRGVRQRADEEDQSVARRRAGSDDERAARAEVSDRIEEEPTARRAEMEDEDEDDGGPRRRRRRRRRRSGSDAKSESVRSSESTADDDQKTAGPAIEAAFDDDYEDAEEVAELRRGRGRRRGRRGAEAGDETETAAAEKDEVRSPSERRGRRRRRSADEEVTEAEASIPRPKHRDVVTWFDTVDILISSNLEKRKREPQRGRGARNGRSGGRGASRKRD